MSAASASSVSVIEFYRTSRRLDVYWKVGMSRITPPRPVDLSAVFPGLAPLARTATRLHPRPGAPSVYDSSVGGPLLWPADEPWPHCVGPHSWRLITDALHPFGFNPLWSLADARLDRRIHLPSTRRMAEANAAHGRREYTTQEWEIIDRGEQHWIPYEDQAADLSDAPYQGAAPTGIQIGRGYKMIIRTCPTSHDHPHVQLMQ